MIAPRRTEVTAEECWKPFDDREELVESGEATKEEEEEFLGWALTYVLTGMMLWTDKVPPSYMERIYPLQKVEEEDE